MPNTCEAPDSTLGPLKQTNKQTSPRLPLLPPGCGGGAWSPSPASRNEGISSCIPLWSFWKLRGSGEICSLRWRTVSTVSLLDEGRERFLASRRNLWSPGQYLLPAPAIVSGPAVEVTSDHLPTSPSFLVPDPGIVTNPALGRRLGFSRQKAPPSI